MNELTRINRLRVQNFRSLADIDLIMEPLTVFIGPNGSGKSTIVDVLRFVRDALLRDLDSAILDRNGISALRRWSAKGAPYDISIQLTISNPQWEGEYAFILGSKRSQDYLVKFERISITRKDKKTKHSEPSFVEMKNGELSGISKDLQRYSDIFEKSTGSLSVARLMIPPIFQLNQFFRKAGFYTIYPDTIRQPQSPAAPYPLDEKGKNLASMLRALKRRKTPESHEMLTALSRVVEGVTDYDVQQIGGYLVTKLHHLSPQGTDRSPAFSLAQESDGTLRMLGLLSALYQIPYLSMIAIEEPELTIHPGALAVLCDVMQEATTRSQVFITTHSPELISLFPLNVLRVVEKVNGITKIGVIKKEQQDAIREKLFSTGEILLMEGLQRETISS
ncbi:AAA family ATPase [candidate division KSB1 bacterium]|nr:AAA family ATPase [candidate division KSB1 bacterium]